MTQEQPWMKFNPNDASTWPGSDKEVELDFGEGRTHRGWFDPTTAFFGSVGSVPFVSDEQIANGPMWRYWTD